MKPFSCVCGNRLHFENTRCLACGRAVGFEPATREMRPAESPLRYCSNGLEHGVCNWLLPEDAPSDRCWACNLNQVIPNLSDPDNLRLWGRLEAAKKRLLYTLEQLELPLITDASQPGALAFRFMSDSIDYSEGALGSPVYTGHDRGVITINLKEADAGARETMREAMNEPYRTLLGHFRHEIGHYFWDQLIRTSSWLNEFRALFGDETLDYEAALRDHYGNLSDSSWRQEYVSAYASAHPWEDWAETWAHYLHMFDGLETAHAMGFEVAHRPVGSPLPLQAEAFSVQPWSPHYPNFGQMVDDWQQLTLALNAMNRSMGLSDTYPFTLTEPVIEKLDFVHRVINDL
ncbi:MAG: putative zinc-binding metallopeptidase [Pseudomonadota bacterium]